MWNKFWRLCICSINQRLMYSVKWRNLRKKADSKIVKVYCILHWSKVNVFIITNMIHWLFGWLIYVVLYVYYNMYWSPQVTVLRSYDTMIATARRQSEGTLIYIVDKTDLYIRVRNGFKQVLVQSYIFISYEKWVRKVGRSWRCTFKKLKCRLKET